MKIYLLLLALLLACVNSQSYSIGSPSAHRAPRSLFETINDPNVIWSFVDDHGIQGSLRLNQDRSIELMNHPDWKTWIYGAYDDTLTIYNGANRVTTTFVHSFVDYKGKWHLEGRNALAKLWRH